MSLRRRIHAINLLVRPRGQTQETYKPQQFKAYATSPHHAEQMARAFAEKQFDIGEKH